jgi:hypothetical protein
MLYIERSSKFLSSVTTFFVSLNLYSISFFRAAAIARNLLEDDSTWERVMQEAGAFQMPVAMRHLLSVFADKRTSSFENNLLHLTEDYIRRGHNPEITKNVSLKSIQDGLKMNGRTLEEFHLPLPDFQMISQLVVNENGDSEITMVEKRLMGMTMVAQLDNTGQRKVFDQVMAPINQPTNLTLPRQFY